MSEEGALPWPGLVLAVIGLAAMLAAGVSWPVALAIGAIWAISLFLRAERTPSPPPEPVEVLRDTTLDTLFERAGVPLMMVEGQRVTMANRMARSVFGDAIAGQDVRLALRRPEALALLDRGTDGSAVIRGLAGRNRVWLMNRKALGEDHTLVELIDRTAEADVSRAHTDFVANASHELRTPLASIIGYVETLADDDAGLDAERRARFFDTILREARRLQQLVQDLMSLSRVEAEKHEVPNEPVDLSPLVLQAARDGAGHERIHRIDTRGLGGNFRIFGDARQLEQLVRNLVDNGLKYGAQDGTVTIATQVDSHGRVVLSVSDEGEGIAREHLPYLTRRFYRTDPSRSRAAGGTGLGLAIVKHIVERHRGQLDIESEFGSGTTVSVRFPPFSAASGSAADELPGSGLS